MTFISVHLNPNTNPNLQQTLLIIAMIFFPLKCLGQLFSAVAAVTIDIHILHPTQENLQDMQVQTRRTRDKKP